MRRFRCPDTTSPEDPLLPYHLRMPRVLRQVHTRRPNPRIRRHHCPVTRLAPHVHLSTLTARKARDPPLHRARHDLRAPTFLAMVSRRRVGLLQDRRHRITRDLRRHSARLAIRTMSPRIFLRGRPRVHIPPGSALDPRRSPHPRNHLTCHRLLVLNHHHIKAGFLPSVRRQVHLVMANSRLDPISRRGHLLGHSTRVPLTQHSPRHLRPRSRLNLLGRRTRRLMGRQAIRLDRRPTHRTVKVIRRLLLSLI
jgi:hypothetical protein